MKRYTIYMTEILMHGSAQMRDWEKMATQHAGFVARQKPIVCSTMLDSPPTLWQEPLQPYELGCATEADFAEIVANTFLQLSGLNYIVIADYDSFETVLRPPEADLKEPGAIDLMFSAGAA